MMYIPSQLTTAYFRAGAVTSPLLHWGIKGFLVLHDTWVINGRGLFKLNGLEHLVARFLFAH